jgi:hypothetical protein
VAEKGEEDAQDNSGCRKLVTMHFPESRNLPRQRPMRRGRHTFQAPQETLAAVSAIAYAKLRGSSGGSKSLVSSTSHLQIRALSHFAFEELVFEACESSAISVTSEVYVAVSLCTSQEWLRTSFHKSSQPRRDLNICGRYHNSPRFRYLTKFAYLRPRLETRLRACSEDVLINIMMTRRRFRQVK